MNSNTTIDIQISQIFMRLFLLLVKQYVLLWWKRHQNVLPILSKLSRMVVTIPASSAKSERAFSTGDNIVTVI